LPYEPSIFSNLRQPKISNRNHLKLALCNRIRDEKTNCNLPKGDKAGKSMAQEKPLKNNGCNILTRINPDDCKIVYTQIWVMAECRSILAIVHNTQIYRILQFISPAGGKF